MPITTLPQSIVRLLGPPVTISSPLCMIKELVDNSVDAGATSIDVSISPNTIDKIQVRDNGHGIPYDDYDLLACRACTSKPRHFDELRTTKGRTLGFRGEALASANSVAILRITTRTADDPVASHLFLKPGRGGLQNRRPASAPVGTTVQASNLFECLPVRRQNALKESHEALPRIKKLLQSYALALPHLELSLTVLGQADKYWTYLPPLCLDIQKVNIQVFGSALVAQCVQVATTSKSEDATIVRNPTDVTLNALLPRHDSNISLVNDEGAFISVDSRPISSSRGVGKELVTIFESHLTRAPAMKRSHSAFNSPFMQLNINCPVGAYDVNASGTKDEVQFLDEKLLLISFENLCRNLYNQGEVAAFGAGEGDPRDGMERNTALIASSKKVRERDHERAPDKLSRMDLEAKTTGGEDLVDFCLDETDLLDTLEKNLFQETLISGDAESSRNEDREVASHKTTRSFTKSTADKNHAKPSTTNGACDPTRVEAFMRTTVKVDLGRSDSNTSDAAGLSELIPVQVKPRYTTSPTTNQSQHQKRPFRLQLTRRFEDIGDYFRPTKEQPIEIALDETATSGNMPGDGDQPANGGTRHEQIGRGPLHELRNADLNQLWDEPDIAPTPPSPELDILQPHNAIRGDLDVPFTQRGLGVTLQEARETSPRRRWGISPPSSSPDLRGPRGNETQGVLLNSMQRNDRVVLPTPPSTHPLRLERAANRPFRLPRVRVTGTSSSTIPGGRLQKTRSSANSGNINSTQPRISFGRSPGSPNVSRRREDLNNGLEGSPGRQSTLRTEAGDSNAKTKKRYDDRSLRHQDD